MHPFSQLKVRFAILMASSINLLWFLGSWGAVVWVWGIDIKAAMLEVDLSWINMKDPQGSGAFGDPLVENELACLRFLLVWCRDQVMTWLVKSALWGWHGVINQAN